MAIINKFGTATSETNIDGVKQYNIFCEKIDDSTNKRVFSTILYYLEKDKDNVESMFNDVYNRTINGTSFSVDTLRAQRKHLLSDSDWTVLPDCGLSESKVNEWKVYRQKLRDITNGIDTEEKAKAVVFPTQPD